jgi:uncharacterized Zn-finger protein
MTTAIVTNMLRCDNCSFEAKSIIGLARHVKHKHGLILSTAKNTCSFCKKVFSSSASCTRHVTTKVCIPRTEKTDISIEDTTQIEVKETKEPAISIEDTTQIEVKETKEPAISIEEHTQKEMTEMTEIKETTEITSHPIHLEELHITKNSKPFVSIFVKIMICSVFFIPFYQRLRRIS